MNQPAKRVLYSPELEETAQRLRSAGHRLVLTNGCFDLLHVGHLSSLEEARSLGDVLFVGVNADSTVSLLKGADRPIMPAVERAEILAALRCVDYVTIFEELTPQELIRRIRPHVHVKGAEYGPTGTKALPEAELVRQLGGEVRFVKMVPPHSSTRLAERLVRCQK